MTTRDKPHVYKMAGCWLWECDHQGQVGDVFSPTSWTNPWSACLAAAVKHYAGYHYESDEAEEV